MAITTLAALLFVTEALAVFRASLPAGLFFTETGFPRSLWAANVTILLVWLGNVLIGAVLPGLAVLCLQRDAQSAVTGRLVRWVAGLLIGLMLLTYLTSAGLLPWWLFSEGLANVMERGWPALLSTGLSVHVAVVAIALARLSPRRGLPAIVGVIGALSLVLNIWSGGSGLSVFVPALMVPLVAALAVSQSAAGRLPKGARPWLWGMGLGWAVPLVVLLLPPMVEALGSYVVADRMRALVLVLTADYGIDMLTGSASLLLSLGLLGALRRGGGPRRWDWTAALLLGLFALVVSGVIQISGIFALPPMEALAAGRSGVFGPFGTALSVLIWAAGWVSLIGLPAIAAWLYLTWDRPAQAGV